MSEVTNESVEQTPQDSTDTDPISRLTALLESELEQTEADTESDDQEAVEADIVEAEIAEETQEDTAEVEEVLEDLTVDAETEDPEQQTFDVDGETLTLQELKLGHLRMSDYTRKTQAVSEQRKALEAQSSETEATMSALMSAAGADLSRFESVNWEQVAVDNPSQYKQAKAAFEQTKSTYDLIKAQAEQFQTKQQQQADEALKEAAKESLTVLKTNIPDWNDDLYFKIGSYARGLGVSTEEFNQVSDHRLITALWKAMQFDSAKQVAATKKVKPSANKTLSGSKADSGNISQTESSRKVRERLKRTGSQQDAVAAILDRIK